MDRLLTQIRCRSYLFLSSIRSLSSFKSNSFDFKSRVLVNLINQLDTTKPKSINSLPSNVDFIYETNSHFPLPGHVGFYHPTKLTLNRNFQIHTYDCSSTLRSEFKDLFLNYNVLNQPLTAITVTFKTKSDMSKWSIEVENERQQLTQDFIKLAQEISKYLIKNNYWVDFINPSNGKPYYGPSTSDTLFETDERLQNFGMNIVDLGCCRVIEHLQHGTHIFVGSIFTSAKKIDKNMQQFFQEFIVHNKSDL